MSERQNKIDVASAAQRHAADPSGTRFASANAGSGKTYVLVNRVSRLLIGGVAPDKILCLTYTKAAASEMQSRLFKTLGEWSVMSEEGLNAKLSELFGTTDHGVKLSTARALFAKALETPGGLKVQTIHAFCEFVLSRFPLETGLLPGFETLQDEERLQLLEQAEHVILTAAHDSPSGDIARAIRFFSATSADSTLREHFNWMGHNLYGIARWEASGGVAPLAAQLNMPLGTQPDDIAIAAWQDADKDRLRELCPQLIDDKSSTNQKVGAALDKALVGSDPLSAYHVYKERFFTQAGSVRASIVTGTAPEMAQIFLGSKANMPTDEVLRMIGAEQNIKAANLLQASEALYVLAVAFAQAFTQAKTQMRRISFDDQVEHVRALLTRSEVADWVGYKLDGGISHILVDEAQDTPPVQWDILDALHENFNPQERDDKTGLAKTFFAVGDEKQSIYSFQGARPETFLNKTQAYDDGARLKAPRMTTSFRSAPQVLELVDQIFIEGGGSQRMFDPDNFAAAGDKMRHVSIREDRGYIELWPLSPYPEHGDEEAPGNIRPVDGVGAQDAREVLAAKIAGEIKLWLDQGRSIYDRKLKGLRPIRAGDVLILVQKRGPLYKALLRHLKRAHVPVVGPDRLVLKEALVVKDLLTLARFVLQPHDDLALAELLKGPFFNWDDDQLFNIAYGRKAGLWTALSSREGAQDSDVIQTLKQARRDAANLAPYEFFARFLDRQDAKGDSHMKKLHMRLSMEVKDAVQSFLARALAHQRQGVPSLHDFAAGFRHDETEVKRELDNVTDEVRIMTVHGAKGLEAPIVILPDASDPPRKITRKHPIRAWGDGYVFSNKQTNNFDFADGLFEQASVLEAQEYLRRLYVALTRAETELIICGYEKGQNSPLRTWYDEVSDALQALGADRFEVPLGIDTVGTGMSYGVRGGEAETTLPPQTGQAVSLPPFLNEKLPTPQKPFTRVTPSHMAAGLGDEILFEPPARSPLSYTPDRFRRGILIHKLLEFLPDIAQPRQDEAALRFLMSHDDLDEAQRGDIIDTVFSVLRHADYADFFGGNKQVISRAEVSISGRSKRLPPDMLASGTIDRLCIYPDRVLIVDYKSNRPPPRTQAQVSPIYVRQMATYAALLQEAYPKHTIECALLWTDGPYLMKLSETSITAALTQIAGLPTLRV